MSSPQRPRAFRIPTADPVEGVTTEPTAPSGVRIVEEPFEIVEAADGVPVPVAAKRRSPWGALFVSAAGGLVSIAVGLSVERMIADLFQAAPWLGWVALALLGLAGFALLAIVVRELAGLRRERKIERLRQSAIDAIATRDHTGAQAVVAEIGAFYKDSAALAAGRQRLEATADAILDVDDRIGLAEHELLAPLDRQARNAIASAARQVSAV
ncbi:TIGR01620 family protein, partial [Methylobacterium trifolii]